MTVSPLGWSLGRPRRKSSAVANTCNGIVAVRGHALTSWEAPDRAWNRMEDHPNQVGRTTRQVSGCQSAASYVDIPRYGIYKPPMHLSPYTPPASPPFPDSPSQPVFGVMLISGWRWGITKCWSGCVAPIQPQHVAIYALRPADPGPRKVKASKRTQRARSSILKSGRPPELPRKRSSGTPSTGRMPPRVRRDEYRPLTPSPRPSRASRRGAVARRRRRNSPLFPWQRHISDRRAVSRLSIRTAGLHAPREATCAVQLWGACGRGVRPAVSSRELVWPGRLIFRKESSTEHFTWGLKRSVGGHLQEPYKKAV